MKPETNLGNQETTIGQLYNYFLVISWKQSWILLYIGVYVESPDYSPLQKEIGTHFILKT